MAAQTLTTALNYDEGAMIGLLDGEAININGGNLTIDSDSRWGQNAAVFGNIVLSSSLGGTVTFEGRNVWQLPFTASSGNVPTLNTYGSNTVTGGTSGATGELLRVWSSGAIAPLASGGAMPATGWVKLRTKTGNFVTGEVVTLPGGATITLQDAGRRSWINPVGARTYAITLSRRSDVKWRGDWYELGTTNGADDQTFQFPVADACPAVWMEKYVGAYAAEGDAGLEPWLSTVSRWGTATQFVATDVRGKYFGIDVNTGVITIARRSTNPCGFKPATGLKVFIPNIILSTTASTGFTTNGQDVTLTSRYEVYAAGAIVDVDCVTANWYFNLSSPADVKFKRTAALSSISIANPARAPKLETVAVGVLDSASLVALNITSAFEGLWLTRVRAVREAQGAAFVGSDIYGFNARNVQFESFGAVGSAVRTGTSPATLSLTRCTELDIDGIAMLGARAILTSCANGEISGVQYADNLVGTTQAAQAMDLWSVTNTSNITIFGYAPFGGLENVQPYGYLLNVTSGSKNCELREIGSPTAPVNLGTANACAGFVYAIGSDNVGARRCYGTNNRGSILSTNNTASRIYMVDCWGDYLDNQSMLANDMTMIGGKWLHQTGGVTAVYGTHWQDQFISDTVGSVTITCNEPSPDSESQVTLGLSAASGWNGAGSVILTAVGDFIIWRQPYFAKGFTSLSSVAITGSNTANHSFTFRVDIGSGFSSWQPLTNANLIAVGAVDPNVGAKFEVRCEATVASASNGIANVRISTVTNAVAQRVQQPLPGITVTLAAQVPLTGAEVRVYDMDNLPFGSLGTELAGIESAGNTFSFDATPGNTVWLQVMLDGYKEYGQAYTVPAASTAVALTLFPELNT